MKITRECSYCTKMFNCSGMPDEVKRCINFNLNQDRAEMYKQWIEEINKYGK